MWLMEKKNIPYMSTSWEIKNKPDILPTENNFKIHTHIWVIDIEIQNISDIFYTDLIKMLHEISISQVFDKPLTKST